jgi:hypothetical protein
VIVNSLSIGGAPHLQFYNVTRLARQSLVLFLVGALPAVLGTASARAGACDRQTVSTTPSAEQMGTAILINEVRDNPYGERHVGSVCWRLDRITAAGQADKLVVHADVDIPDFEMRMAMDFDHNGDRSTSASHFVTITFEQPPELVREVITVPGIILKHSEKTAGTPFAALGTKIAKGSFLVSLSGHEADLKRNLQLLKERSWFDIPLVYANQRRAVLAVEKGYRGDQIFREAMAEWERTR